MHFRADVLVTRRKVNRFLMVQACDFRLRACECYASAKASNRMHSMMYVLVQVVLKLAHRHPQIGRIDRRRTSREDSGHQIALLIERNAPPHYRWIAAETALPQPVA
jgi:hypothetical protein